VIGSFSWTGIKDAYWLASAFWFSSLILSILGILLPAQQITVLRLLGKPSASSKHALNTTEEIRRFLPLFLTKKEEPSPRTGLYPGSNELGEWRPRWKMVFTWQCPIMFMSYSVCFFSAGLTIYVCTPLIRRDSWSANSNVSQRRLPSTLSRRKDAADTD